MASENVEIVKAGYAAFGEGGAEALMERLHPEFEMVTPPEVSVEPDTYRGADGLRRYFDSWYEQMEDLRFDPHGFHEVGDKVVVEFTLRGRGRATGIEVEQEAIQLWELEDGMARRTTFFQTLDEGLEAAKRS